MIDAGCKTAGLVDGAVTGLRLTAGSGSPREWPEVGIEGAGAARALVGSVVLLQPCFRPSFPPGLPVLSSPSTLNTLNHIVQPVDRAWRILSPVVISQDHGAGEAVRLPTPDTISVTPSSLFSTRLLLSEAFLSLGYSEKPPPVGPAFSTSKLQEQRPSLSALYRVHLVVSHVPSALMGPRNPVARIHDPNKLVGRDLGARSQLCNLFQPPIAHGSDNFPPPNSAKAVRGNMAGIMQVEHESTNSMKRVTKEGKQLTYELVVMQQPERARACGSGAKSSADRRPVDPPPVVQLRIFEGEEKKDITYPYNANFFLFTTLESARPIAQPRLQPVSQAMPVLTGMPVAGIAYLDRPDPAGYFIFPDLSVRHEGKYRLNFNLYEEAKESKDEDAHSSASTAAAEKVFCSPMAPQSHVHFRLEVRSKPFHVFSAKKFPGLTESTHLSKMVADQGCRVRIRRDVRMRRRDTKPGKGYDNYEDETGYARSERYVTPDMFNKGQIPDRPRSVSTGSVHGSVHGGVEVATPYSTDARRLSQQDVGYFPQQNYQQQSTPMPLPPVPIQQPQQSQAISHLNFGGLPATQYQVPALPPAPSNTSSAPSQGYAQNNTNYTYQAPPPSRLMSTPNAYGYGQSPSQPQPQYSQNPVYAENSHNYRPIPDYRRTSLPLSTQQPYQPQPLNTYIHQDNRPHSLQYSYYPSSAQQSAPRSMTPNGTGPSLPPLSTIQSVSEKKYESVTPGTMNPISAGPISQTFDNCNTKYGPYVSNPHHTTAVPPIDTSRTAKRSFGSVFDSSHLSRPMHSGMRPGVIDQGREVPQVEAEDGSLQDEYDVEGMSKMLTYRRADGTRQVKKCPSPITGQ
ncbi:MAG: hypothetical protein Q9219_007179 [cf. Caloplaca sp. 3 TL-2023]